MERITATDKTHRFTSPVVTLGNFDGVHLGHQKIFKQLIQRSRELGGESVVYTFKPHPIKVLHPDSHVQLITSYEERADLIENSGVDVLVCAAFDREFARQGAREFVRAVLGQWLGARQVLVGYDYVFGKDRKGNTALLQEMGQELGFEVEVIPPVMLNSLVVSSSRIRRCVQEGDVALANRMLGREFAIEGTVGLGHHRGKALGYPTANLTLRTELIPKPGVYAVRVRLPGHKEALGGMANLGFNPTFEDRRLSYEVHIFDFDGDLYGQEIRVAFVERLREEKRFSSPEALVRQLRRDEEAARTLL